MVFIKNNNKFRSPKVEKKMNIVCYLYMCFVTEKLLFLKRILALIISGKTSIKLKISKIFASFS